MELFMDDAIGRRHPLHVARADQATRTCGITVLQLALVDNGHGLETTVRMLPDPAPGIGWGKGVRAGIVQQQERADLAGQVVIGEQAAHREAIAYPVGVRAAVNTQNLFHEKSPLLAGITLPMIPIRR
ncbi:hypothetical protein D3C79_809960 [compost metagenome]